MKTADWKLPADWKTVAQAGLHISDSSLSFADPPECLYKTLPRAAKPATVKPEVAKVELEPPDWFPIHFHNSIAMKPHE